jgi:hypothetical protein
MGLRNINVALGNGDVVLPASFYRGLELLGDADRPLVIDSDSVGHLLIACTEDDEDFCGDYRSRILYFGKRDGRC